jgi:hypothetical protein
VSADAEVLSLPAAGKLSFALLPQAASNANAPTTMIFFMPVSVSISTEDIGKRRPDT